MTATASTPVSHLAEVGACSEARDWIRSNKHDSLEAAWLACERGDWLLWYAGKKSGGPKSASRKRLVLVACACARETLPLFEKRWPNDMRVRECLETAEQWALGENGVTLADVRAKRAAAYAVAAGYAYAAAAPDAGYAAAAAYAAAAVAAVAAAPDAPDAYAAAADAYAYAARVAKRKPSAVIVRTYFPTLPQ